MAGLDYHEHPDGLTADTWCSFYPCVTLGRITIAEPTTTITDYILTIELTLLGCAMLQPRLLRPGGCAAWCWGVSFLLMAVSFFWGGTSHGFAVYLNCTGQEVCNAFSWAWVLTCLFQMPGLSIAMPGTSILVFGTKGKCAKWNVCFWIFGGLLTLVYSSLVIIGSLVPADWGEFFLGFTAVILFAVPSILVVLVLFSLVGCCCCTVYWDANGASGSKPPGSTTALIGWIIGIVAIGWQATGIGFSENFNHNDIFHVIYMVSVAVLYCGLSTWFASLAYGPLYQA